MQKFKSKSILADGCHHNLFVILQAVRRVLKCTPSLTCGYKDDFYVILLRSSDAYSRARPYLVTAVKTTCLSFLRISNANSRKERRCGMT
jgi:hypothetical protein